MRSLLFTVLYSMSFFASLPLFAFSGESTPSFTSSEEEHDEEEHDEEDLEPKKQSHLYPPYKELDEEENEEREDYEE